MNKLKDNANDPSTPSDASLVKYKTRQNIAFACLSVGRILVGRIYTLKNS